MNEDVENMEYFQLIDGIDFKLKEPFDFDFIGEYGVHELMHIKMYPLDQITESLITSNYDKGTNGYKLAYSQFLQRWNKQLKNSQSAFF